MRTQLNVENSIVILRNMVAYWLWHHFVSTNAVKLANNALHLMEASPVSTSEISDTMRIGVNYMAAIGLGYRLSLAIAKTNDTRTGIAHSAFTYLYNQTYVGIFSNKFTLQLMMLAGLIHNYSFHHQSTPSNSPIKEFLFQILMPMCVGGALDQLNSVIPFRNFVVDRIKGLQFIANCCIWGGIAAPRDDQGNTEVEMARVQDNIHNPLS